MATAAAIAVVGSEYCEAEDRELTVRKTSFFSPDDGFAAYDHRTGGLAFRVDTYAGSAAGELALLGPAGEPILTIRRKRPSLHHRWECFLGERADGQKPLFSARRSSILGGGTVVEVLAPSAVEYRIVGSFPRRCCRLLAAVAAAASAGAKAEEETETETEVAVAEIRRKVDESAQVVMGRDVFSLWIKAGFDAAFAMAIVLVLDRITGDELDGDADGIAALVEEHSPV